MKYIMFSKVKILDITFMFLFCAFSNTVLAEDNTKKIGTVTYFNGNIEIIRKNEKINNNLLGRDIYIGDKLIINKNARLDFLSEDKGELSEINGEKNLQVDSSFNSNLSGKNINVNIDDEETRINNLQISSHGLANDIDEYIIGPIGKIINLEPIFYLNDTKNIFNSSKKFKLKIIENKNKNTIWEKSLSAQNNILNYPLDTDKLKENTSYTWEVEQGEYKIKNSFKTLNKNEMLEINEIISKIDVNNPSYDILVGNIYKKNKLYFDSLPFFIKLAEKNKNEFYPHQELAVIYKKLNLNNLSKQEKLKAEAIM